MYDHHGNMKGLPHLQLLEWNHQDELVRVELDSSGNVAHYSYDGGGHRTREIITNNGLKQKERLYLGLVERYQEYDNNGVVTLERWTLQVEGLAQVDTLTVRHAIGLSSPTPVARYQYRDRLGSSTIEANEQGQVISYEEYYPYGRSAYRAAASGVDLSLKRYRFTGKERDNETGLDYFGVRYYASWLGRWTSGDPGGFVDGVNVYRYTRNNPVNGIDVEGYSTKEIEPELPPLKIENEDSKTEEKDSDKNISSTGVGAKYYNRQGEYLGSYGKKKYNDKVYVFDSVVKNEENEIIEVKNPILLKGQDGNYMKHSDFVKYAATVFGEASTEGGKNDDGKEESFGIASAIRNRMKLKDTDIISVIKKKAAAYYRQSNKYKKLYNKSLVDRNDNDRMKHAIAGVINALTEGYDYSEGATGWDGRDLLLKGLKQDRYTKHGERQGLHIPTGVQNDATQYIWNVRNYYKNRKNPPELKLYNKTPFSKSRYVVTTAKGQTLFYRASYRSELKGSVNNHKAYPLKKKK